MSGATDSICPVFEKECDAVIHNVDMRARGHEWAKIQNILLDWTPRFHGPGGCSCQICQVANSIILAYIEYAECADNAQWVRTRLQAAHEQREKRTLNGGVRYEWPKI